MQDEIILTGYCRALDQSRLIEVEMLNGRPEADCAYPDCPHSAACPIAKQLESIDNGQ